MSRPVYWSAVATNEAAIALDISGDEKLLGRILARAEGLGVAPDLGVRVSAASEADVRMQVEAPFRILYLVQPSRIDILGLVLDREETAWPTQHAARA